MKLLRLACLALGHNVDAITGACHMCGQQLLHPINVRRERARLMSDAGRGRITLDEFARRYDAMRGPDHLLPIATLNDGRPYRLFEIDGIQVVDGERCVVGLWVNNSGVQRALVRVATIYDPEAVLS